MPNAGVGVGQEPTPDSERVLYAAMLDFNEFLTVQKDIFSRLIDIVNESGTGFAFPCTVNDLVRDRGVDAERTARNEAIMRKLRDGKTLPFPDFDMEMRKTLRETLDYPAQGSVESGGHGRANPSKPSLR